MATKLKIQIWPSPILRKRCKEVKVVDQRVRELLDEMFLLMRAYNGIGLAANQAGVLEQLVVIDFEDKVYKLVNPCIVKKKGRISFQEGCLSFPEIELSIARAEEIVVEALTEYGEKVEIKVQGLMAVALQHEIDHINGIVFIDRVSPLKRLLIRNKLKRLKS